MRVGVPPFLKIGFPYGCGLFLLDPLLPGILGLFERTLIGLFTRIVGRLLSAHDIPFPVGGRAKSHAQIWFHAPTDFASSVHICLARNHLILSESSLCFRRRSPCHVGSTPCGMAVPAFGPLDAGTVDAKTHPKIVSVKSAMALWRLSLRTVEASCRLLHKPRMVAKLTSRMVAELTYREGEYNLRGSSAPNSRRTC